VLERKGGIKRSKKGEWERVSTTRSLTKWDKNTYCGRLVFDNLI